MTEQDTVQADDSMTRTDSMTQAELMAKLIRVYDVPMNLIRYERLEYDSVGMVGPTTKMVGKTTGKQL